MLAEPNPLAVDAFCSHALGKIVNPVHIRPDTA